MRCKKTKTATSCTPGNRTINYKSTCFDFAFIIRLSILDHDKRRLLTWLNVIIRDAQLGRLAVSGGRTIKWPREQKGQ